MRKYTHSNQCTRPVSGMYDVSILRAMSVHNLGREMR